ncbi:MAG: hypothetical protein Q8M17_16520 [Actinomycetota bacterium]|nr:hypothetical protein [Actinomycetota bacterium]
MSTAVPPDLLREVIREVVREVIREVVAEEIAAAAAGSLGRGPASSASSRRHVEPAARRPDLPGPATGGSPVLQRGALTERHVRAVDKSGTITIGKAVVITPLARERARSMGVQIIRIEG